MKRLSLLIGGLGIFMTFSLHAGPKNCVGLICSVGSGQPGSLAPVVGAPIPVSRTASFSLGAGGDVGSPPSHYQSVTRFMENVARAKTAAPIPLPKAISDPFNLLKVYGSRNEDYMELHFQPQPNAADPTVQVLGASGVGTSFPPFGALGEGKSYAGIGVHTHPAYPKTPFEIENQLDRTFFHSQEDLEDFLAPDQKISIVKGKFGSLMLAKPEGWTTTYEKWSPPLYNEVIDFLYWFGGVDPISSDRENTFGPRFKASSPDPVFLFQTGSINKNDYAWLQQDRFLRALIEASRKLGVSAWLAEPGSTEFRPLYIPHYYQSSDLEP